MSIDTNIPLLLSIVFILGGLVALAKSADVFVDAAAAIARGFGLSPLIVGMVIIGFGTSAPELVVSAIAGASGHADLSLGNAYGSNIFNIGVILGVTALIWPIRVKPSVNWFAVPLLLLTSAISWFAVSDGVFERANGIWLLVSFAVLLPVYCWYDQRTSKPAEAEGGVKQDGPRHRAGLWDWARLIAGLAVLVASSHIMVWGCVDFARDVLHVSNLLIGLTIVAAGTSLPELASSIASARRGENEFVIGNIVGSNFFNALAVVGVAGTISPFNGFSEFILSRDLPVMTLFSAMIALFGVNCKNVKAQGMITRTEGGIWVALYAAYLLVMFFQETAG